MTAEAPAGFLARVYAAAARQQAAQLHLRGAVRLAPAPTAPLPPEPPPPSPPLRAAATSVGRGLALGKLLGNGTYGCVVRAVLTAPAPDAPPHLALKVTHIRRGGDAAAFDDEELCVHTVLREAAYLRSNGVWVRLVVSADGDWRNWGILLPLGDMSLAQTRWDAWVTSYDSSWLEAAHIMDGDARARAAAAATPSVQPVPVGIVQHVGFQIASQLTAAQAAGWMHRDVKPSNILMCDTGAAGYALRGWDAPRAGPCGACQAAVPARPVAACGAQAAAAASAVAGLHAVRAVLIDASLACEAAASLSRCVVSPWWRAPELVRCQRHGTAECPSPCPARTEHTSAVDVWSLGVMLLNAARGRHLTVQRTLPHLDADVRTVPQALAALGALAAAANDEAGAALADLLRGMLADDAASRSSLQAVVRHPFWTTPLRPAQVQEAQSWLAAWRADAEWQRRASASGGTAPVSEDEELADAPRVPALPSADAAAAGSALTRADVALTALGAAVRLCGSACSVAQAHSLAWAAMRLWDAAAAAADGAAMRERDLDGAAALARLAACFFIVGGLRSTPWRNSHDTLRAVERAWTLATHAPANCHSATGIFSGSPAAVRLARETMLRQVPALAACAARADGLAEGRHVTPHALVDALPEGLLGSEEARARAHVWCGVLLTTQAATQAATADDCGGCDHLYAASATAAAAVRAAVGHTGCDAAVRGVCGHRDGDGGAWPAAVAARAAMLDAAHQAAIAETEHPRSAAWTCTGDRVTAWILQCAQTLKNV